MKEDNEKILKKVECINDLTVLSKKEEKKMLNRAEYVNGSEVLREKEKDFKKALTGVSLEELTEKLEIPCAVSFFESLTLIKKRLWSMFVDSLLKDSDFLEIKIIDHFHREDGTHVFCMELLDEYVPRECCEDIITEWSAITFNPERMELGLGVQKCHVFENVEDSSYRGNSVYEVKALIDHYRNKTDY